MGNRIKRLNGDNPIEGKQNVPRTICWIVVSFLTLTAGVFVWKWPAWKLSLPIDAERWGQFGDFIGGLLGSVFTLISVYYLHSTYMEQRAANIEMKNDYDRHIEWEKERRFEENFNTLLSLYKDSTRAYSSENSRPGKYAMDLYVKNALDYSFDDKEAYLKKVIAATSTFFSSLSCSGHVVNAHMRLLYQLLYQLDNNLIEENEKRIYAKSLRSQLTDMELVLVRYNCWRKAGENMRPLVAKYNMLKHLPLLSLLEYKKYALSIGEEKYVSALNDELVVWRKDIRNLFETAFLEKRMIRKNHDEYGKFLKIKMEVNEECKRYVFELTQDKDSTKGVKDPVTKALMGMTNENLKGLLEDFHREVFEMGNFRRWNDNIRPRYCSSSKVPEDKESFYRHLRIEVTCKEPIIATFNQIRLPNPKFKPA